MMRMNVIGADVIKSVLSELGNKRNKSQLNWVIKEVMLSMDSRAQYYACLLRT